MPRSLLRGCAAAVSLRGPARILRPDFRKPSTSVTYELEDLGEPRLRDEIREFIAHQKACERLAARDAKPSGRGGFALGQAGGFGLAHHIRYECEEV